MPVFSLRDAHAFNGTGGDRERTFAAIRASEMDYVRHVGRKNPAVGTAVRTDALGSGQAAATAGAQDVLL